VLHSAACVFDPDGTVIAKIILRYSDHSSSEIEIKLRDHVGDWWGDEDMIPLNKGSELVWTGLNPQIKKRSPDKVLRVFRSTFENPRPNVSITSMDYVSTMHESTSFMLGLTLD